MRNLDSCRRWWCMFWPCRLRNKLFINFWNRTFLLCILCIYVHTYIYTYIIHVAAVLLFCFVNTYAKSTLYCIPVHGCIYQNSPLNYVSITSNLRRRLSITTVNGFKNTMKYITFHLNYNKTYVSNITLNKTLFAWQNGVVSFFIFPISDYLLWLRAHGKKKTQQGEHETISSVINFHRHLYSLYILYGFSTKVRFVPIKTRNSSGIIFP
jgi:hypothetical protein